MAEAQPDFSKKGIVDANVLLNEAEQCESLLTALKVAYEQYFLGLERRPPTRQYEDFKKRILALKGTFTKSTQVKFRIQSVHQKFVTYERLWQRTLKEIEDGTYSRDLFKAKMHSKRRQGADVKDGAAKPSGKQDDFDISEDLGDMGLDDALADAEAAVSKPAPPPAKAVPPVAAAIPPIAAVAPLKPGAAPAPVAAKAAAPVPAPKGAAAPAPGAPAKAPAPVAARPAAAPPKPAGASGPSDVSDAKVKAIYDAYVTAKRRCGEDTSKLTMESVAATVRKQVPEIMKQHNAKGVDFKVVIKDGKALLRAVPKE